MKKIYSIRLSEADDSRIEFEIKERRIKQTDFFREAVHAYFDSQRVEKKLDRLNKKFDLLIELLTNEDDDDEGKY